MTLQRRSPISAALIEADKSPQDSDGLSWSSVGYLTRDAAFVQVLRRVHFMRYQWTVRVDDYVADVMPLLADHRYRALVGLYSARGEQTAELAEEFFQRLDLAEWRLPQQTTISAVLGGGLKFQCPEEFVVAERRPTLHADDVASDLVEMMKTHVGPERESTADKLARISPDNADSAATRISSHIDQIAEKGAEWEARYGRHTQVLRALIGAYHMAKRPDDEVRLLRAYLRVSPDAWAYQWLAKQFLDRGDEDEWKATLDEFLAATEPGLDQARVQVEIARYYMRRREFEAARPYAAAAAESWAEWAMLCAIDCYLNLGEEEKEGLWRSRICERYPQLAHQFHYYLWAVRTGGANAEEMWDAIGQHYEEAVKKLPSDQHGILGCVHTYGKRYEAAFEVFNEYFFARKDAPDPPSFFGLLGALLADELKKADARDKLLEGVAAAVHGKKSFRTLAEALRNGFSRHEEPPLDASSAARLIADADEKDRCTLSYLVARALDSHGGAETAVEFYKAAARNPARTATSYLLSRQRLRELGITEFHGR